MKRLINFLKVEKWLTISFFASLVVAVIAIFVTAFYVGATTPAEFVKSIFFGTLVGVLAFAILASLYHPEK